MTDEQDSARQRRLSNETPESCARLVLQAWGVEGAEDITAGNLTECAEIVLAHAAQQRGPAFDWTCPLPHEPPRWDVEGSPDQPGTYWVHLRRPSSWQPPRLVTLERDYTGQLRDVSAEPGTGYAEALTTLHGARWDGPLVPPALPGES